VICPLGHKCNLTKQPYKYVDYVDDKDISEFRCKTCNNKGKCKDGAYVCA